MRTGESPSGPPPVGRVVVLSAVREFTGTDGKSRRARITYIRSARAFQKGFRDPRTFLEHVGKVGHLF